MTPPRRLVLFAPSPADETHARQRRLLAGHEAGLEDRGLVVTDVFGDAPEASDARRELGAKAGAFAAVLVGRDGGVKARSGEPLSPQELFDRIDAMPMRRREVREREAGGPGPSV